METERISSPRAAWRRTSKVGASVGERTWRPSLSTKDSSLNVRPELRPQVDDLPEAKSQIPDASSRAWI